jgi:hypothetical protein
MEFVILIFIRLLIVNNMVFSATFFFSFFIKVNIKTIYLWSSMHVLIYLFLLGFTLNHVIGLRNIFGDFIIIYFLQLFG